MKRIPTGKKQRVKYGALLLNNLLQTEGRMDQ